MTTYRLPELLGGGEVEATENWGGCAGGRPEYRVGGITVLMPPGMPLEQISPPVPVEPGIASVVLDCHDRAWQHLAFGGRGDWCCTVDDLGADWEELNREYGPLVHLVHAPEPVELPWVREYDNAPAVKVSRSSASNRAAYVENWGHLTADDARQMARALWTVANEHELEATS